MAKDEEFFDVFDEGNIAKLDIFRKSIESFSFNRREVLKRNQSTREIRFFDFFCGPGCDQNGVSGSPLIIIEQVQEILRVEPSLKNQISIFLSDINPSRVDKLEGIVTERHSNLRDRIFIKACGFQERIGELKTYLNDPGSANYILLDPFGVEVPLSIIRDLALVKRNDIVLFTPSSFINRFKEVKGFEQFSKVKDLVFRTENDPHGFLHRKIIEFYRREVVANKAFVSGYGIKRGSNLVGIIFLCKHHEGARKFLEVCWKVDPDSGDSNFDHYGDLLLKRWKEQDNLLGLVIPGESDLPERISSFVETTKKHILEGGIKTDKEAYLHALRSTFLPKHLKVVYKGLRDDGIARSPQKGGPRTDKKCLEEPRKILHGN